MNTYLISQGGRQLAYIEAPSPEVAIRWSKGIAHIVEFSPSAPITADIAPLVTSGVASFRAEYFKLLGFLA